MLDNRLDDDAHCMPSFVSCCSTSVPQLSDCLKLIFFIVALTLYNLSDKKKTQATVSFCCFVIFNLFILYNDPLQWVSRLQC